MLYASSGWLTEDACSDLDFLVHIPSRRRVPSCRCRHVVYHRGHRFVSFIRFPLFLRRVFYLPSVRCVPFVLGCVFPGSAAPFCPSLLRIFGRPLGNVLVCTPSHFGPPPSSYMAALRTLGCHRWTSIQVSSVQAAEYSAVLVVPPSLQTM